MNATQIRAELEAVKTALREGRADIADLQARTHRASSSLVVLIDQRRRSMTPLEEHDLRKLVALWAEINAALEARGATRWERRRSQNSLYGKQVQLRGGIPAHAPAVRRASSPSTVRCPFRASEWTIRVTGWPAIHQE
jgi:hypothetical protein